MILAGDVQGFGLFGADILLGAFDAGMAEQQLRGAQVTGLLIDMGQVFGAERRGAGSNGIIWPSLRFAGGNCIAAFWPDVVPIPTQGAHFAYHWNGGAVD